MSAIGGISSSAGLNMGLDRRGAPAEPPLPKPEARALVPVRRAPPSARPTLPRPDAAFLAHLIASREQAPQTRARRRAEPGEATAAYGAQPSVHPAPRSLSRWS
jgi:hypothetical protein